MVETKETHLVAWMVYCLADEKALWLAVPTELVLVVQMVVQMDPYMDAYSTCNKVIKGHAFQYTYIND